MPLNQLTLADLVTLSVDMGILLGLSIYFTLTHWTSDQCKNVDTDEKNLSTWRFALYASIFSIFFAEFFTFVISSPIKYLFHGLFIIYTGYTLYSSLPAWVCKKRGFADLCNCDYYRYNDFIPMLILGSVGGIIFAIFPLSRLISYLLLLLLGIVSMAIYKLIPEKTPEELNYPTNLLIDSADTFQQFLLDNPDERKMITILDGSCSMCELQTDEINRVSERLLEERIRIYDLTLNTKMDPIIPITLNITNPNNILVPTSFIFEKGMVIEQKDGVLSKTEIEVILNE